MMKIDEIMEYYSVEPELIPEELPLTAEEKRRILDLTLKKAGPGVYRRTARKCRPLLIACLLIMAAFTISFAAYQYALSDNALNLFRPEGPKQLEALNSIGTEVNKETKNNGLTVRVKEIIGDRHTVHVLFDVILPKELTAENRFYTFRESSIEFKSPTSMGWSINTLGDDEPSDQVVPFIISLDAETQIGGQNMTLHLQDFSYYDDATTTNDGYVDVVKGTWNITFALDYQDNSVAKAINQPLKDKEGITLKSITLSPISANIELRRNVTGIIKKDGVLSDEMRLDNMQKDFIIHLKNGKSLNQFGNMGTSSTGTKMTINISFDQVVDLNDIDYVELFGNKVKMTK